MGTNEGISSNATAPAAAPRVLKLEQFVRMFRDSVLDNQDIRYCFILGSGASVTSDVPSGAKLVDWWLTEMYRDSQPGAAEDKLRAWVELEFADLPAFTWDIRASFYGQIYNRRFPDNASGQTWLRKLMENKRPSFGYTVLARILSQTRHNLVITTNFDNLVHDALIALSYPNPFIAHGHEDARFVANHEGKIRILKLHGDIDRETYNADALIADLQADWREPLRHLLGSYTPVFLGYGGCDPGFMRFLLEAFAASDARPRPVWTYRVDAAALKPTSGPVNLPPGQPNTGFCHEFMTNQRAWWLPTPGFDELMLLLGYALGYPHGGKDILGAAKRGTDDYQKSLTKALQGARSHTGSSWCIPLQQMLRLAEQALLAPEPDRPWSEWNRYINDAIDSTEQEARCRRAIATTRDHPGPYARLAATLAERNPSSDQVRDVVLEAKRLLDDRFPPDSNEALSVRNNLAVVLRAQGDYNAAANAHREIMVIRERALGAEHPDTLSSRHNLAEALDADGKNAEAEAEYRTVLGLRERILGQEHPDTLKNRNNLANSLYAQGKYSEAEKEHRNILAIRERVLGPEHPDTLKSRNNLANALLAQGKCFEAEAEHRAVLAIRERVLGAEHPGTAKSHINLANTLFAQGKFAEAEAEYHAVSAIMQRVLGPEHPDTLQSRNNLALALFAQIRNTEAEAEHRAVLAIRERVLGPEHPDVFGSCHNLALCLVAQGKKPEAQVFARRALAGWQKTLGEDHPNTKNAKKLVEDLEKAQ